MKDLELPVTDPTSPDAKHSFNEPRGLLVVARLEGRSIGRGALTFHGTAYAEMKRIWVDPAVRRLGIGRRILDALGQHAGDRGMNVVRTDTYRALTEAIRLCRAAGDQEIDAFNDQPYAHHWFDKRLDTRRTGICVSPGYSGERKDL